MSFLKKYGALLCVMIAGVAIVFTYIVNGSEKEDAWLYAIFLISILFVGIDVYRNMKKQNS